MQHIQALIRRKSLAAATVAFVMGAGLLIWTFVATPAASDAQQPGDPLAYASEMPAALDAPLDGTLDAIDAPQPTAQTPDETVLVYVSGAVAAPDVYRLPAEARVKDLVLAAGGLRVDADMERLNLAARVTDGQHVTVPRIGAADTEAAEGDASAGSGEAGVIDINRADAEELDALPGIGAAIAARIVEHREASGPFRTVEDLQEVKGIGAALFEKIAPLVTVGP